MDYFEILAECSVTLGGFAVVHAALRGSTGPRGAFRAWASVAFAFTPLLMALIPLLLSLDGELDAEGWRLVSALGLVPCAGCHFLNLWLDYRLDRAGHPAQIVGSLRSGQGLHFVAIVATLANLLGWPWAPGIQLYALATTLLLVCGVIAIVASFWLAMRTVIEDD